VFISLHLRSNYKTKMMKKLLLLLFVLSFNVNYSQGNYLDFDGTDDFVAVPNSGNIVAGASAITMSCKVYPTRVSSGFPDFDGILGYRDETGFDFYIIQLSTTDIEARFRNSNGTAYTITYTGLVLNQWNQFFLVYDGSANTLKLYSGSTEVSSVYADGVAGASSTNLLNIGNVTFETFDWYHLGYIDEVSLWNKALSAFDIVGITNGTGEIPNPAGEANLKLYYKFNQGVAYGNNAAEGSLIDQTGTQNGALYNFALTGGSSNWGGVPLSTTTFTQAGVNVYPNPSSSFVWVLGLNGAAGIKIVDMTGRVVSDSQYQVAEQARIDVSYLNSGVNYVD